MMMGPLQISISFPAKARGVYRRKLKILVHKKGKLGIETIPKHNYAQCTDNEYPYAVQTPTCPFKNSLLN